MSSLGSTINKDKVGNIMVYLAERIKPLYHTKLIKLLYFIDEYAVKDNGIPITWLDYNLWEKGPVAPETYFIKNQDDSSVFLEYIKTKKQGESFMIIPNRQFDKRLFSDYELEIIDQVITELGNKRAEELIKLTHAEGSLWGKTKKKYNVAFSNSKKTTNYNIELSDLVKDDKNRYHNFQEAKDMILFSSFNTENHGMPCMR